MFFFFDRSFKFIVGILVFLFLLTTVQNVYAPPPPPPAPTYTISAHGSSSYGVDRTSLSAFGYSKGNCAHCHEQHSSIGGTEPTPNTGDAAGPDKYCLFALNFDTTVTLNSYAQSDSVCFYCHVVTDTYQTPSFNNYTYSATFGGCPTGTCTASTIFEAFNSDSYHNLYDVWRFITGLSGSKTFTSFPSDSNPCSGCHNVHKAKRSCGKPTGSYDDTKSAISKPGDHNNLWGDSTGEKMSNYTASYQAPYWYSSTANYEPENNTTYLGTNLPDYVTFCTDCHNSTNTIYSTTLGRNLKTIDWNNEKHGKGIADTSLCGDAPYPSGASGLGKVLSCLDCHEPHGAPNVVLIRKEVNGGTLSSISTITAPSTQCIPASATGNKEIAYLCDRCHKDDIEINSSCQADHWYIIHHDNTGCNSDLAYTPSGCGTCHATGMNPGCTSDRSAINCNCCHYHGSSAAGIRTF